MAFRPFIVALLGMLTVIRLAGADSAPPKKLDNLVNNSPFGSAKSASGNPSSGEALEFRAVLEENGSKFFSIYDTATHRSNWVEINDPVNGFSVKGYDSAKESITVEYQGKSLSLAIKRAPAIAQAMQMPQPQQVVMTNGGVSPPGTTPAVQGAPTAVDQQRIQQIQEEIRRRRALRSQAMTPGGSPAQTQAGQPNYGGGPQPLPQSSNPQNFGGGPQPQPSTSSGPIPQPSNSTGPQLITPKS